MTKNVIWTSMDLIASTREDDEILLVFTDKDGENYVFGLKKKNAKWLVAALKRAIKLRNVV